MRRGVLLLAALGLAGCSLEPAYVRPAPSIPSTWPVGAAYPSPQAAGPALDYAAVFQDPRLKAVIDRALAGNQDLAAAMANVQIARAQYHVQRAELLPHLNATVGESESRGARSGPGEAGTRDTARSYEAEAAMPAFELDLFGRLRSLSHAARDQYLASEAGARAARLTLVGDTADAWFALAADRTLLAIAEQTEASAQRTVQLVQARLSGGVAPRTDLAQAQTVLDQARADRAGLITAVAQDRNALELLIGGPAPDDALPATIDGLASAVADVPAGLSSQVLLARPDVQEAERRLQAANAEIGAARAAFFPSISLTALAGAVSPQLSALFAGGAFTWQGQAATTLPLFAGGANVAGVAQAKGERALALAQYQKAVQTAFREVADALARRGTIDAQLAAQRALVEASDQSYSLGLARYRQGVDPYLSTLDAQRTLYAAQRQLATTRLTQAQNRVALYQSLGGGALATPAS
jgi:multidrug efflux system outer membrane protein